MCPPTTVPWTPEKRTVLGFGRAPGEEGGKASTEALETPVDEAGGNSENQ